MTATGNAGQAGWTGRAPGARFDDLYSGSNVSLLAISAVVMCICLIANAALQKRRLLALNWPDNQSHARFAAWVKRYLLYHGWKIDTPDIAVHLMIARKDKEMIRIFTESSLVEYNHSRVNDMTREALARRPHPLVCVNARPVPAHLMAEAAQGQALVITYQELHLIFDRSVVDQKTILESLRVSRLAALSQPT